MPAHRYIPRPKATQKGCDIPPKPRRLTVKPIPVGFAHWANEVQGAFGAVERMDAYTGSNGKNWVIRMTSYYVAWLYDLLNNPPDGMSREEFVRFEGFQNLFNTLP